MSMDRGEALRILGLPASASDAQIKVAYRDLAKVWHPDRFTNDVGLRAQAEETLKLINTAYRTLAEDTTRSRSAPTFFSRASGDGVSEPVSVRKYQRRSAAVKEAPDAFARKFFVGFFGYLLLAVIVVGCIGSLLAAADDRRGIPQGMTSLVLTIVIAALAAFGLTFRDYLDGIQATRRFKN